MKSLAEKAIQFLLDEDGPTAVEYAVMLGLIFLAVVAAITTFGQATSNSFSESSNSIDSVL